MAAPASGRVFQFKLVLLGDSAVGKSSLVLRFVRGQFFEYQESTIGAAFLTQTVALNDTTVKFEIWDTAGQERYHSLAPMYYRGAAAAIVVYDITNRVCGTPTCDTRGRPCAPRCNTRVVSTSHLESPRACAVAHPPTMDLFLDLVLTRTLFSARSNGSKSCRGRGTRIL
eukprot:scaffold188692_cov33-Tisochrysis_lutea.AAC.3